MENYIVRIYRRDDSDPYQFAGIFESVERETRKTFTSLNSLIDLLVPNRGTRKSSGVPGRPEILERPETVSLSK